MIRVYFDVSYNRGGECFNDSDNVVVADVDEIEPAIVRKYGIGCTWGNVKYYRMPDTFSERKGL